jgi:hypothetical protein
LAKRTAKFACAILVSIVGSTLLTLLPRVSPVSAEDCLTEPTSEKVDGQHWYYRSERGSNRRCWYLKDTTGAAKDTTTRDIAPKQSSSQASSAWDFAQPTAPKLGSRSRASSDTLSDAKAQPATGTPSVVRTQPASASFDDNLQRDMPAAPWQAPQTQMLDSADIDTPASPASATTPDEPATDTSPATSLTATDTAPAKPVKPTAPIHKLLMVMVGALALSGLLASAQYRLSKAGRARRRNRNWQRAIMRARKNRDKPRSKPKTVHAGIPAGRPAKAPMIVAEPVAPAVRIAAPPPPAIAVAVELPPAIIITPAKTPDPTVELADLFASRAKAAPTVKAAPQPAASVPSRQIEVAPPVETSAPAKIADPAAELVDLLGSHAAKKAVQQPKQANRPAANATVSPPQPTADAAPPRLPAIEDPAAELANLLESRFAPPPAPPVRHAAAHPKPQAAKPQAAPPVRHAPDRGKSRPQVAPADAHAKKVVDPITELADLLEAKENQRAARLANAAAPRRESPPPVKPIEPPAARPLDPAAELFGMLEARAKTASPPVQAPRPIQTAQPIQAARPIQAAQPIEEAPPVRAPQRVQTAQPTRPAQPARPSQPVRAAQPVQAPQSTRPEPAKAAQPVRPAQQQPAKAAAPRRKKVSPAPRDDVTRADIAPAKPIKAPAPTPAPADPVEYAAAPRPGKLMDKAALRASRQKPLPPALMETPNHDGPTPPLDFIPRPQALRPRVQDIRQDESLDGVQDILARLARHG